MIRRDDAALNVTFLADTTALLDRTPRVVRALLGEDTLLRRDGPAGG